MKKIKQLVRFDWAMKKMLRNKANFDILEGFLSELLSENITIKQILESEGNKETQSDKHNKVDILVENSNDELVIIEVQNSQEFDYFHRILYGTSKAISEHIQSGNKYSLVKKVISITIAYFDLGQGGDYVYHGTTDFRGIHNGDVLTLGTQQKELYKKENPYQIFPEYWLIKVSQFNDEIKDKLDEWVYFLKNGAVQQDFTAKGLPQAKDRLNEMMMTEEERLSYKYYLNNLMDIASAEDNKMLEIRFKMEDAIKQSMQEGIEKGMEKKEIEIILEMYNEGFSIEQIAKITKKTEELIQKITAQNPLK